MSLFIIGFFSGVLAVLAFLFAVAHADDEPTPKPRKWRSVQNAHFTSKFDLDFPEGMTTVDVLRSIPKGMARFAADLKDEDAQSIEAGFYTVELDVSARFIGREKEPSK